jgi:hypothetical protein
MNRRHFMVSGLAATLAASRLGSSNLPGQAAERGQSDQNPQTTEWKHAFWVWAGDDAQRRAQLPHTSTPGSEGSLQSLAAGTASDTAPPEWRDQHVYFRKTFALTNVPGEATIKITAERLYQLWVNGMFIGEGPALVHPRLKSYDEHSIGKHLRPGMNVVAIHGYFDGHDITNPITPPGLLCELLVADSTICTDGTWKTLQPRAWSRALVPFADLVFQEHYFFGVDPTNWKDPDFDDHSWIPAKVLGSVGDTALPWSRPVPRQIPFLTREEIKPVAATAGEIVEWRGGGGEGDEEPAVRMSMEPVRPLGKASVNNVESLVSENTEQPCTLLGSDLRESLDSFDGIHDPTIILDFGKLRNAYFAIDLEASEVVWLDIGYGPDLIEGRVMPYRSTRTRWADRLVLTAGRFTWRSTQWRQFRYVQLTLRRSLSPVKIHVARAEAVRHSFRNETVFSCPDGDLEKFWKAAARTEDLVITDILMDCASRERRQYAGYSASAVESLHGDEPIIHHYLRQISTGQLDDGFIMDSCPGKADRGQTAADAGFYHVLQILDHWEHFGERELLEEHFPHCLRHLDFWKKFTNSQGLLVGERARYLGQPLYLYFDDAALDLRGTNLVLNAFYCLNLRAVAAMAKVLGKPAERLNEQAQTIGQVLTKSYWDEKSGLFCDTVVEGQRSALTSEHSQGIMLYAELASREQAKRMVSAWQQRPEQLAWAEIGFLYYVVEGLTKYGYTAFAVELLRKRLNRGLRGGREQFGELLTGMAARLSDASSPRGLWTTGPSRASAHGAGAWPPAFLLRRVAGLQMRLGVDGAVRLAPSALVSEMSVVWSGHHLAWSLAGNQFSLDATLPSQNPVEIGLPFEPSSVSSLVLNGVPRTLPEDRILKLDPCQTVSLRCTLQASAT